MGSLDMRTILLKAFVLFAMASAVLCFGPASVMAQVSLAPMNPAFLDYLQKLQESRLQRETVDGYALGFIPDPLDLSHLIEYSAFQEDLFGAIPATYDLRSQGRVTPVRNQGPCGSCWAFASYASLESNLLTSETTDFSENNLKNTHGYDTGPCGGGNSHIATAYLARWSGPVAEVDDPYNPSSGISPAGLPVRKHVQEVLNVPNRASFSDNNNLKKAVMDYGAVSTTFYIKDTYFNASNSSYYYPGDPVCLDAQNNPVPCAANHGVAIVGWEDDFDKNKFSPIPPGDGAFIVKNSWGTGWGENGYFYISYYDYGIGKSNWIFNGAESTENYDRTYEYDPLGWISGVGFGGQFSAWFSNVFTAVATEELRAVSFYTASPDSIYEIYIYTDVDSDPTNGFLMGTQTGTVVNPGYHTIPLDPAVLLLSGQTFSVVVKLATPGYPWSVAVENPIPGYSSQATAQPGQSYISPDGIIWYDLTSFSGCSNWNVCLKAFTVQVSYRKVRLLTPNGGEAIPSGSTYPVIWGAPAQAERFKLLYSSDGGITWKLIAKNIPRDSTGITGYPWEVPKTGGNKKGWLMKIVGYGSSGQQVVGVDQSAPFTIEVVKVTSPNGGEVFHTGVGGMWNITWRASPETHHFDLMFSMDNKLSWRYVEGGIGVTGRSFTQAIPPPGNNRKKCFIKVIAYDGSGRKVGLDYSDSPFTVEVVKLTFPNGGGTPLKSEDPLTITWTKYNTIRPVTAIDLYFTKDGGLTWKPIATNLSGDSVSYPCTVPKVKALTSHCKVKVVLKDETNVIWGSDVSDKYFSITP